MIVTKICDDIRFRQFYDFEIIFMDDVDSVFVVYYGDVSFDIEEIFAVRT